MMFRLRIVLAAVVLLAATFSLRAYAQGYRIDNRLIPESSVEYPGDIGIWAHTYLQILIGPRGGLGYDGGLGPGGGLTPAQMRQAYNLPSAGGSQIIAIVDAYHNPNALADFNAFSTQFGLPTEPSTIATASTNKAFQVLYGNGVKPSTDSTGGWELEEALDIEWAHAMAPNAKILLVEATDSSFTSLLEAEDAATSYTDGNGLKVKEVSNSWGGSEFSGENSYDTHFNSSDTAYFVSAGDSGAPAEYPSVSPYVVSAGGTTVNTNSSGAFTSETGWSSGGGGPSAYESRPSFQSGIASIVGSWRGTPDIAFGGDPNTGASVYDSYPYYGTSYTWWVVGGTSWSSPSLAGIANLAATSAGAFSAGSQALLTTIYSNLGTANFRDITSGNNGYPAKVGWDFVTGVGSCIGLAGLQGSTAAPPVIKSLSPSSIAAGAPAFTLAVKGTGFVSASTVNWNGAALTTTFVSATQLKAKVPVGDIASPGTAKVTIVNPSAVTSSSKTFTIVVTVLQLSVAGITKDGVTGAYTVTVNVKNTGHLSAPAVTLTSAMLGSAKTSTTLPLNAGGVASGATTSAQLTFAASAGGSGSIVPLKVSGTFTGGKFNGSIKVTLP